MSGVVEFLLTPTEDTAPTHVIPCWVTRGRDAGSGLWQFGNPAMCVDKIAEWLTRDAGWVDGDPWLPTCTGCKNRFLSRNPFIEARPMP